MEFEDQDLPFKGGDDLSKPEVGVWLTMREAEDDLTFMLHGCVITTYDSLREDWGSDGEHSWSQRDVNERAGYIGHWYAILETEDPIDGTWSVASYEVLEIDQCAVCDGRIGAAPRAEVVFKDDPKHDHKIIHQSCYRTADHEIA